MVKRLLSLMLVVAMIFSLATVAQAAPATNVVIAGGSANAELTVGSTVSLPVSITQNPGLAVAQVIANWDSTALKLTSVEFGTMPNNSSAPIEAGISTYTVCVGNMLASENNTATGTLFTLNFEILSTAVAGSYTVALAAGDFLDKDINDVTASLTNGTVALTADSVATIGSTGYSSLAAAVAAAGEGDVVVLNKDIELSEDIEISGKKVDIDLNGNTITATSDVFTVSGGAELSLSNGEIDATGIVVWSVGNGTNANIIDITDVTATSDTFVVYHNGLKYGADVSIVDSALTSANTVAVYLAGRATVDTNWAEGKNNTLSIEDSAITGTSAVEVKRGDVTVTGDATVLTATGTPGMTGNTSGPASSGYALALTSNKGIAVGSATVTGGDFVGKIGIEVTQNVENDATFTVSGGSFDEAVPEEYCAEGYEPKDNGDGTYGVQVEIVAYIGATPYNTLAAAVAAAGEGDVVVLNKDIELSEDIEISGKKVDIDLNGNTITATSDVFTVSGGAELSLSNGEINATGIVVWSVGNGTNANIIDITDVTATSDTFVVYHNGLKYGADVSIVDSALTSANTVAVYLAGRATVDTNWAEGKNNTLSIEDSAITGTSAVEVKRTDVTVKEGSELTATGTPGMTGNTSGPASSGYALALTSNKGIAVGSATVTGGDFVGKIGIEVTQNVENDATFAVSGGSFDEAVPEEYCAEGYEPKDNGDGTYGVEEETGSGDSGGSSDPIPGPSNPSGPSTPVEPDEPEDTRIFDDVGDDHTFITEIEWAYHQGYVKGVSEKIYNSTASISRQQLWMVLGRHAGVNPADMAAAKAWAVEIGITDGSNPGAAISRQQMVTILYRYAQIMGYNVSGAADLSGYPDAANVADYASDAMAWAVANGIVNGTTAGDLNSAGNTTRGAFAAILYRFCDKIA